MNAPLGSSKTSDQSSPDASSTDSDWPSQIADTIDSVVEVVRDKAVVPITTIARAIVYGLLAAIFASMAAVLVAILLVRVLNVYIDDGVWIADLIVGVFFILVGLMLWSRRSREG